jgi:beta-N-acetylhexosaminidase
LSDLEILGIIGKPLRLLTAGLAWSNAESVQRASAFSRGASTKEFLLMLFRSLFRMSRSSLLLLVLSCVLLLAGCASRKPALEDKIGQMLMIGFRGTSVSEGSFIVEDIRKRNLGGVILFDHDVLSKTRGRNIVSGAQVRELVSALQAKAATPLLIAVDQEGGRIARLKERDGFPASVSHSALGQRNDLAYTAEQAGRIASLLAELGINVNLAPDVDLCSNPDNPVIAKLERCFSADPRIVTEHAAAYVKAHRQRGILTALKHFPGHGSSRADSHLGFVDVTETWDKAELEPYAELIKQGLADMVMTAHVFNAKLDPENPATLSPGILDGKLRRGLGFEGVLVSDDMQMGAIVSKYGFETAVRKALEAGTDILIFGNNLGYDERITSRVVELVKKLVHDGALTEERIDQSYRRIMRLKERLQQAQGRPAAAR